MSLITEKEIQKLIVTYTKTYNDNPSIMLSGYGQENQTVADYNGRQLLELMQNAEDAQSDIISIKLDTANHLLSMANNGISFSLEGVESLMYTGLSTKNKAEFIGNKGLGFRSVLNWVHQVKILTKEVSFRFSKTYSEQYFDEHIAINDAVKQRVEKEIVAGKLSAGEIPIAVLAFPEILAEREEYYVTKVVLDFRVEELPKIEEQIGAISEEILLFLPNIKKIVVEKNGEQTIELTKFVDNEQDIVINDSQWNIYRSDEQHYRKGVKFKYAIAWKDDLNTEGLFYNYFSTDVATDLPCIIHATFDLTNNRKEINDNAQNVFILSEIVTALGIIADQYLKSQSPDWRAYQFLSPGLRNNRKILKTFFEQIEDKRESIACYPTLNGYYVTKEEAIYHGAAFSVWVEQNGFGGYFPNLLKTIEDDEITITKRYEPKSFSESIAAVNPELTIKQRVELIGIFAKNEGEYFSSLHRAAIKLPLLLNTKNEIVPSDIKVFTKDTEDTELEFPDYITDIEFISTELYRLIRQTFSEDIKTRKQENESGDARAVKRFLDPLVNIGLDDITGVIQHVVSETNKKIKTDDNPQDIIQQMVVSLYSIFLSNPYRRGNLSTIDKIPLLSRSNKVGYAEDLYFGKEYTIGTETELIFEGVKEDDDYLAGYDIFKIEGTEFVISSFFKWLNVNQYAKLEIIHKDLGRLEQDGYTKLILSLQKGQRVDVYKTYNVRSLKGIEKTLKDKAFSIEKLIAWIAKDEELLKQLRWTSSDEFYIEFNKERRSISHKPPYVLYLILASGITRNVVASMPTDILGTFKTINPADSFFIDLKIPEYKILEIADLLHIKNSFNDLKPDQIYQLLKGDQHQFEEGSQSFYKTIYEYFKANEKTQLDLYNPDFTAISYYCRRGGVGKTYNLQPIEYVYYSDNKLLPQKILENYWFINLPKRIGENRVAKFFGVKLIKDIIAEIQFDIIKENVVSEELNRYIDRVKPYWLSYRLESLNKVSDKKEVAKTLKDLKIQIAKEATYTISDGLALRFDDFDFIPKDNLVIIQYSENTNIENLRKEAHFCDVIAEIVCVIFKVADLKNTYRRIFKDGVIESHHILRSDEKEYLLNDAKKLLGTSQEELVFWQKVFPNKITETDNEEDFLNAIIYNIGQPLPDNYKKIDFSNFGDRYGIEFLQWLVAHVKVDLCNLIMVKTLENWHKERFSNCIKDHLNQFEQLLWQKANESEDISEKESFFDKTIDFDNSSEEIYTVFSKDNRFVLAPDYDSELLKWTKVTFGIDLQQRLNTEISLGPKYRKLLKEYSFGESIDDMEKIIKSGNRSIYSLMHFENYDKEIKTECQKQQAAIAVEFADQVGTDDDEETELTIVEGNMFRSRIFSANGSKSKHNGGSHTSKGDRKKASSGKKQEDKVKKSLMKQGFLINPVSVKTDSKHYDLEYKKEGDTDWRFLEVKKDSGGYFFLSKAEKETAVSKRNADKYDIAIVGENSIYIVKSPFLFEDESFEHNSRFIAEPTEYKINFKIDEDKN